MDKGLSPCLWSSLSGSSELMSGVLVLGSTEQVVHLGKAWPGGWSWILSLFPNSCMAFPGSMALVPARFGALRVQMTPGLHVALKQSTLPRSPEKTAKICNSDYVLGKWRNNEASLVCLLGSYLS